MKVLPDTSCLHVVGRIKDEPKPFSTLRVHAVVWGIIYKYPLPERLHDCSESQAGQVTFNLKPQDWLKHSETKAVKQKNSNPERSYLLSTLSAYLFSRKTLNVSSYK